MKNLITKLNIACALLFGVFSWLQREDDNPAIYVEASRYDAVSWILFYGLIAILFVLAIWKVRPLVVTFLITVFALYQMITTGPALLENMFGEQPFTITGESMSPTDPRVELSREFFGALIGLIGITFLLIQNKTSTKKRHSK